MKLWILQPNEWLLFQIYDLFTAWLWWVMTYLHTIKEFIMTIYHQSNVTRFEEVQNNARRAANIVLAVNLPEHHRAEVGLEKRVSAAGHTAGQSVRLPGESPEPTQVCVQGGHLQGKPGQRTELCAWSICLSPRLNDGEGDRSTRWHLST